MNDDTKNTNGSNLEMPATVNNVVKPIPVTETPQQPAAPQEPQSVSAPVVKPIPIEQAPQQVPQQGVVPTPVPAAPQGEQKEVGTVMVGKPMSNIIKPIPVGDIQGVGPVATVGGGTEVVPEKKNNIVALIILIVGIIFLVGYVLFTYVLKDKIGGSTGLTGTTKNGNLVYENPKKGDKITFALTNTLKLIVTVDDLEVQESAGTKLTCSVKEADGSESVTINNVWLTDDNALNIGYSKVGNYAIIQPSSSSASLNIIAYDGKVTKLDDLSSYIGEEKGFSVKFSSALSDKIEIEGSRVDNSDNIHYGDITTEIDLSSLNEEEQEKYSRYVLGDGFNMCVDEYSKIPETATISALLTFSLKDGKIDFNNPEITEKQDFKTYYETSKEYICQ